MEKTLDQLVNCRGIPSPPTVAAKLLEVMEEENTNAAEFIKILSADPKLAAKLIEYCNSPLIRRKRDITSLKQAVVIVGIKKLRLLALSFSLIKPVPGSPFDYDLFWKDSLARALACASLGSATGGSSEELFLLGLILNVGQIALATEFPDDYTQFCADHGQAGTCQVLVAEAEQFGADRYEVSAAILRQWSFPDSICEHVQAFSHTSPSAPEYEQLVGCANLLAPLLFCGDSDLEQIQAAIHANTEFLADTTETYQSVLAGLHREWQEYSSLIGFNSQIPLSVEDIERIAKEKLVDLSMQLDLELETVRNANFRLNQEVNHDPLTRLKNRRAFDNDAPIEIEKARQLKTTFAMVALDIDHFKSVNDTYGHQTGDLVLAQVGNCLMETCRAGDGVYRIGGEEFVILMLGCTKDEATNVAERLRRAVAQLELNTSSGDAIHVTISLGVAWSFDCQSLDVTKQFEAADKLLYASKDGGRNRCSYSFAPA